MTKDLQELLPCRAFILTPISVFLIFFNFIMIFIKQNRLDDKNEYIEMEALYSTTCNNTM